MITTAMCRRDVYSNQSHGHLLTFSLLSTEISIRVCDRFSMCMSAYRWLKTLALIELITHSKFLSWKILAPIASIEFTFDFSLSHVVLRRVWCTHRFRTSFIGFMCWCSGYGLVSRSSQSTGVSSYHRQSPG